MLSRCVRIVSATDQVLLAHGSSGAVCVVFNNIIFFIFLFFYFFICVASSAVVKVSGGGDGGHPLAAGRGAPPGIALFLPPALYIDHE